MQHPTPPYLHGDPRLAEISIERPNMSGEQESLISPWLNGMGVPLDDVLQVSRQLMLDGQTPLERAAGAAVLKTAYDAGFNASLMTKIDGCKEAIQTQVTMNNDLAVDAMGAFKGRNEEKEQALNFAQQALEDSYRTLEGYYFKKDPAGFSDYSDFSVYEAEITLEELESIEGVIGELAAIDELDAEFKLSEFLTQVQGEVEKLEHTLNSIQEESEMEEVDDRPAWEKLMEEDRTLEPHVARYETDEATDEDYVELAYDSYVNGQFKDQGEYLAKIKDDDRRRAGIQEITERINTQLQPDDPSFAERNIERLKEQGVYPVTTDDLIETAYTEILRGNVSGCVDSLKEIDDSSMRTRAVMEIKDRIGNLSSYADDYADLQHFYNNNDINIDADYTDADYCEKAAEWFEKEVEEEGVYETEGQKSSMSM